MDEAKEVDIDDWIAAELDRLKATRLQDGGTASDKSEVQGWSLKEFEYIGVTPVGIELRDLNEASRVLEEDYCNESEKIVKYFTTLKRLKGMSRSAFRTFLKGALKYAVIKN